MKKKYLLLSSSFLLAIFSFTIQEVKACHGSALLSYSFSVSGTGVTVSGTSPSPTCGCDPYRMEVEVRCNNMAFTGAYTNSSATMTKPSCIVQAYPNAFISFNGLCPGGTYKFRSREYVIGSNSAGPWTATNTFTVPGTTPALNASVSATPTSICAGQCATLSANASGACSGPFTYTWSNGLGTGATKNVCPTVTTTYTVTVSDACSVQSQAMPVTVTVNPPPIAGTASLSPNPICSGQTTTLTLIGSTGNIQWQSSPNNSTWTNVGGATSSSYTTGPLTSSTYYHAVVSAPGCNPVTSNSIFVTVNPMPTVTVNSVTVCAGQSATLTATPSISGGTFLWNTSANTTSITVSPATTTTYSVVYTLNGCATPSVSGTVIVNPLPVVSVSPSAPSICTGGSVTLAASGASTYSWSPGTGLSGTTGASIIANPIITTTYTVTGTSAAGCINTTTVTVIVTSNPVANAGPDIAICSGFSTQLNASGGANYVWSPTTGLSDPNISNPIASPTVTTTYTVTASSGTCSATDNVIVTVNPTPVVAITPSAPSICAGTSISLTASGAYTYSWAPSAGLNTTTGATVTANPATTTTYTITGTSSSGCISTSTVTVTVYPLPVITISPANPTICNGGSVTLTASGATTYSWSPSTGLNATTGTSVTASPTSTTAYTIIGTGPGGCTNTATVTVTVTGLPVISVSPAAPAICIGSPVQLIASGAATYSWSPATGLSSVTGSTVNAYPTSTTTYTVTGTDAGGCVSTTTVTVTVNPLPIITVTPASAPICIGNSVNLTASGANAYSWSNSGTLSSSTGSTVSANPSVNSSYTVTGIDANGCIDSTTATITVNPLPLVTVNSTTICSGTSATLNASGASTYSWSNAGTLSSSTGATVAANPTTTTSYIVTGTDANSCVNTDTAVVTVNALPTIVLTPPSAVICFGDAVALSASGANTYSWTPGAGLSATTGSAVSASPTTTTTYTVTGTDNNLCVNSSTIQVTVNPLPNVSVNAAPPAICEEASTTLTATGADIYSWTPSSTLNSSTGNIVTASPTDTTLYTITGTNTSTGCINTANINIIVYPLPSISVTTSSDTICVGQTATLTASGGVYYSWTPAPGLTAPMGGNPVTVNPSNPNTTNTYTVTGFSNQQCPGSATVDVYVNPSLNVIALSDASICIGKDVQISAFATGGNSAYGYTYSWMPPIGLSNPLIANPIASPTTTTTYTINVFDNCNTPQASASVTITVNPLPVIAFQADTNKGCVPLALQFNNLSNSSEACLWDFGDGSFESNCNPSHIFENVGNYDVSLTVTDTNGCKASLGNFPVQVNPYPVAHFTMGPQPTTILNPMIFFNSDSSSVDVSSWWWDFAGIGGDTIPNPEYLFPDTGSYDVQLMVVNEFGCYDSITQRVIILGDYTIYIPNAFTPNGDGINELWGPQGMGINEDNFEMLIFDRWGQLIYTTKDINKPWDGIPRDGSLISQQDVYIYKITVKNSFGEQLRYNGHFSLIR